MDNGIYLFYMGTTGETVKARYSFVYTIENGKWKISHHHSSQMPEQVSAKEVVKEGLLVNFLKDLFFGV